MENRIEVSTDSLRSDHEKIETLLSSVRKALGELQGEMQALNAMWEGPANTAFTQTIAADFEDLESVCKGLDQYLECLSYAQQEYDKCESQVADTVNAIQI